MNFHILLLQTLTLNFLNRSKVGKRSQMVIPLELYTTPKIYKINKKSNLSFRNLICNPKQAINLLVLKTIIALALHFLVAKDFGTKTIFSKNKILIKEKDLIITSCVQKYLKCILAFNKGTFIRLYRFWNF
jgi:hypothetical protein